MGKHQNNTQLTPVLEPDEITSPVQIERLEVVQCPECGFETAIPVPIPRQRHVQVHCCCGTFNVWDGAAATRPRVG